MCCIVGNGVYQQQQQQQQLKKQRFRHIPRFMRDYLCDFSRVTALNAQKTHLSSINIKETIGQTIDQRALTCSHQSIVFYSIFAGH